METRKVDGFQWQVPSGIVVPLLLEAVDRYGRSAVAAMVGDPEGRTLFGILHERDGVRFEVADRIAARLAGPDWWLEGPQRAWYFAHSAVFGGWGISSAPADTVELEGASA